MPIADSTLILEGQQDFSGGMDSSLSPTLISANAVATAVNLTFRGGRPRTRPGFRQVSLFSGAFSGNEAFTKQNFQGSYFYQDSRVGYNSSIIGVFGGYVVKIDLSTRIVDQLTPIIPAAFIQTEKVYIISALGNTDWTSIGAGDSPAIGTQFTATGIGSGTGIAKLLSPSFSVVEKCYFVQAEQYLIIQNGKNTPLIFDGNDLFYSGIGSTGSTGLKSQLHTIGSGTIMAYGQGRLFVVSSDKLVITAGDLVYGGSTSQVSISSGSNNTTSTYRFNTVTNHGFSNGDRVTVTGHSSSEGLNGTWIIKNASGTIFDIDFASTTAGNTTGAGGFVAKFNAGSVSDLLRFTETNYLALGGSLQVPSFMGKINGMVFMPVQDTGTGQGDLLVFCERGTASFAVAVPRDQWNSTQGFQRVVFTSVGATSQDSVTTNNADVFFRSFDGLRSYRNARAELGSYGQVPMSAEMNSVLSFDNQSMLGDVSSIVFDNRLLFTATPSIIYSGLPPNISTPQPTIFSKIVALDFTTLGTVGSKRVASYDGVWAGLNVLKLFSGLVGGVPKAYIMSLDIPNGRINSLWEITTNAIFDYPNSAGQQRISSILETKAYSFGSPAEQKRMIRADFWLSDLAGTVDAKVYWRPDQYPCWREWHSFSRCATTDNCIDPGVTLTEIDASAFNICFSDKSPTSFYYRLGSAGVYTNLLQYIESDDAVGQASAMEVALNNAGFVVDLVTRTGTFPNYCFTINSSATKNWESYTLDPENFWNNLEVRWDVGNFPTFTFIPAKAANDSSCLSNFTLKNLQPQYRPQIRMPTPPEDSDAIISRPYIYGNDFQLRLEFDGHFELNRILMLGQRILEQYQGTDSLEVL